MALTQTHIPSVIWAQRPDKLYVTINVEDCSDANIKFEEQKLIFSGFGGPENEKIKFELNMEFYDKIIPTESRYAVLSRHIPIIIKKSDKGPYWPRLQKTTAKAHWLKTDFSKWKDEDDSDNEDSKGADFEDMMHQMGNFGAGDADDLNNAKDVDSDDEDLPDLE